jgi:uncharacterized protein (DUF58 family)
MLRKLERSWVLILIFAVSIGGALSSGHQLFFNLAYLSGALLILSYLWAWLNLHWVRVTRQTRANHIQVGGFIEERLTLKNTGPLPKLWVEFKDESDLPLHRASRVISNLRGKRQQSWHVRTPCFRRGRFTLGPVSLFSSDPFGLFPLKKDLPRNFSTHVVVYPLAVDIPGFQPPVGEQIGGEASRRRTHYVTTNVSGVRDYVFGDSFNRIHWPSTARTGRMIVKEFELDPVADIWIILDMDRHVQAGPGHDKIPLPTLPEVHWEKMPEFELAPSTEEYGVTIAASLSKHFLNQNRNVGLITYADAYHREIAQSDRGERQLTRLYEMLAVAQAHGSIPLAEVLAAETMALNRNTTVIVVTPSTEVDWIAGVRNLSNRGVNVTAVVIDPASFDMPYNSVEVEIELTASHVPHYVVRRGDRLDGALNNARSTSRR